MEGKPSILFVDDESCVLEGLSRNLATEAARWDMSFCSSPKAALDLYKSHPFNIVVVDMMMPAINGIELVLQMKRISHRSTYIMLTGASDMRVAVEAINSAGIFRFFPKPCSKLQLVEGIAAALDSQADQQSRPECSPERMVLDSLKVGVVVLDVKARVLLMNGVAGQLCSVADGLYVGADRIFRLSTVESTAQFHDLIRATANGGHGGLTLIERPRLGSPLSATVTSVPNTQTMDALVGVYLRDPLGKLIPSAEQLASLFNLTPAEARIAHSLVLGCSLEAASALSGIAIGTARNYLKKVFLKTGATRQSELVRMILGYF